LLSKSLKSKKMQRRLFLHSVRRQSTAPGGPSTTTITASNPSGAAPLITQSVATVGRRQSIEQQPFQRWDNKKWAMVPPRTFTEACEAPKNMISHMGKVNRRKYREVMPGETPEAKTVKERIYDHPPEMIPGDINGDVRPVLDFRHMNKMYCISNEDLRSFFPEGPGGKVSQLFPPGHPRGFLYRKHPHMLKVFIDKIRDRKDAVINALRGGTAGLILDGETGTGKSALLCQAVHYARAQNVLTLYIPNASAWTHGEWSWPNVLLPGFFDVPDATREMFLYFSVAHRKILEKLSLRCTPSDLPVERGEKSPKTLYDLCDWVNRTQAPTSIERQSVAIKYLLDELLMIKDIPVLYVVDGMNLLAMDTHFRYPHPDFLRSFTNFNEAGTDMDLFVKEMPRIPSSRLAFMRGLNKVMESIVSGDLPGHCVIGCTTRQFKDATHTSGLYKDPTNDTHYNHIDEYTPFYAAKDTLLHPMNIPNFDEYEYRAFLKFLINSGELAGFGWGPLWHHSSSFERKLHKIEFMSGRNPQKVVDHYHQEFLWTLEYERIRQKQYKTAEMLNITQG